MAPFPPPYFDKYQKTSQKGFEVMIAILVGMGSYGLDWYRLVWVIASFRQFPHLPWSFWLKLLYYCITIVFLPSMFINNIILTIWCQYF